MKVVHFLLSALFLPLAALAGPDDAPAPWEACLDQADFRFDADTFLRTNRVAKAGCRITFTGQESRRFVVDLCAPLIRIEEYPPGAQSPLHHQAGSAACPAPLFGADFSVQGGQASFMEAKKEIFGILGQIKKALAPDMVPENARALGKPGKDSAKAKLACTELLLREYLEHCEAFPAPKAASPAPQPPSAKP